MRQQFFILVILLSFTGLFADGVQPAGSGTVADPYQVEILDNLLWITTTYTSWDKHYVQTADIDASDTQNWVGGGYRPIGWEDNFSGSYNGQHYIIDGLYINRTGWNYQGLFCFVADAVIENVGLTNISYNANGNVGGLAGFASSSEIRNCYTSGSINGNSSIGGLVGYNDDAVISNCYSSCSVTGIESTGGLVGGNYQGTVNNSYSYGAVAANDFVGGLMGFNGGTVSNCFWDVETSNQTTSAGGTGKTTAEMQDVATYTSLASVGLDAPWDFAKNPFDDTAIQNFWNIYENVNNGYPFLQIPAIGVEPVGSGTVADPYQVEIIENLLWITTDIIYWDKHYIQTADIDATETQLWSCGGYRPIGFEEDFTGTYNGQNHVIDGLFIDRQYLNYQGMFGSARDAVIENVGLTNISYNVNGRIGGLAGFADSCVINNCFVTGSINGDYSLGGLLGWNNDSVISNCFSTCSINGLEDAGGLVGNNHEGSVINSYSCGVVYSDVNAGGLVGSGGGTVNNCFWDMETSNQATSAGGTGKTTAEMQDVATYTSLATVGLDTPWDFVGNPFDDIGNEDYWDIDETTNNGYPFLANPAVNVEEPYIPNPSSLITNLNHYPNPFNPNTTIHYSILSDGNVELSIYNIKGQKVKQLLSDQLTAGEHSVVWDGKDERGNAVSSGIYLYRLETGNYSATRKMLLMK